MSHTTPLFPWARSVAEAIWEMLQLVLRQRAEAQNEMAELREINDSRGSCLASAPIMLCSQCFPASLGGWEEPGNIWYTWNAASVFVVLLDYPSTKPSCTYKDHLRCSLPSSHCQPPPPPSLFGISFQSLQCGSLYSSFSPTHNPFWCTPIWEYMLLIQSFTPVPLKCYNFFLPPRVVSNRNCLTIKPQNKKILCSTQITWQFLKC